MESIKNIFYLLICYLFIGTSFTQSLENLDYYSEGDKVIITYDFLNCQQGKSYDINLTFKEQTTNNTLFPKSIEGDFKNVLCGSRQIIWDVRKDYSEISGKYFPQLNFNEAIVKVSDIDGNEYKTVVVGNQIWFAENLKTTRYNDGTHIRNVIDSKEWYNEKRGAWCYYENDEGKNLKYGKLYNWNAVNRSSNENKNICPVGWHVPKNREFLDLFNYLNDAKKLNEVGFNVVRSGFRTSEDNCMFVRLDELALWWTSTECTWGKPNVGVVNAIEYDDTWETHVFSAVPGLPVRCIMDVTSSVNIEKKNTKNNIEDFVNKLVDIDGNIYKTVVIGNQEWMAENLKTTRFSDGTKIPSSQDDTLYKGSEIATFSMLHAYCKRIQNTRYVDKYGLLYNWYAVSPIANGNKNVCPTGWHVPSSNDWEELINYNAGPIYARNKLIDTSWHLEYEYSEDANEKKNNHLNFKPNNISGFSALPGGGIVELGEQYKLFPESGSGWWWSSSINENEISYNPNPFIESKYFYIGDDTIGVFSEDGYNDMSIRCLKDDINFIQKSENLKEKKLQTHQFKIGNLVKDIDGNEYKTVVIGKQEWFSENLKTSKYNDGSVIPEINDKESWKKNLQKKSAKAENKSDYNKSDARTIYGYKNENKVKEILYNWNAVNTKSLCPIGWHIPSNDEWNILVDYLGGKEVAGGKLKMLSSLWKYPNFDTINLVGFNGIPSGFIDENFSESYHEKEMEIWWSSTLHNEAYAYGKTIYNEDDEVLSYMYNKNSGFPVRCLKNDKDFIKIEMKNSVKNSVNDIEGNTYETIKIGNQEWFIENLKTSKYNDGSSIKNVIKDNKWEKLNSGAWCYYNNDEKFNSDYGKLYNWYAISSTINGNKNVCPTGWHVPTDSEWSRLVEYLSGKDNAGGFMKEVGTTFWNTPNTNASNSSIFSGLPSGNRGDLGFCSNMSNYCYWWSSTENISNDEAWYRSLGYNTGEIKLEQNSKKFGYSIRCIKD